MTGGARRHAAERPSVAASAPSRVVIERVEPEIDCGRHPAKRVAGETLVVSATIFADGHDRLAAVLKHRGAGEQSWHETAMEPCADDRWQAAFRVPVVGRYEYTVEAWVDAFATWRWGFDRKVAAGQDVASELLEGAALVEAGARRAVGDDAAWLAEHARHLERDAAAPELASRMARYADRSRGVSYGRVLAVDVERERAAFGAWYECFPRSVASEPGRHGTLRDLANQLSYVASMGFDVLYLPPIHPIGRSHRKGPNNTEAAGPGDPGSPWAIGGPEGGHTAIHPELGTLADFDDLVGRARALGIEIALDLAFQTSPDHPWVKAHPEWFRRRPDGTIQYAENPPKRYQDIYPLDFESGGQSLRDELLGVVLFWVARGVTIFRVDNPHTKPFAFWEWLIAEVRRRHPEVVFLAEAFTRPSVMRHLAKVGFSQSYTYFTWRNTKAELVAYVTELRSPPVRDYMRPNLFVNTPDILHEYLQTGGRPAFQTRLVLAATLAESYGVYGPPFELAATDAVPGSEEYLDSEKYQVRHWRLDDPYSLRPLVTRVNEIRRAHAALRPGGRLRFVPTDNEQLLAYVRLADDDLLVVVVNLDPHHPQSGHVELPLDLLELDPVRPYQAEDLLGGGRYLWYGARNYVALDPQALPAHIFQLRRRVRTERDFDYYL